VEAAAQERPEPAVQTARPERLEFKDLKEPIPEFKVPKACWALRVVKAIKEPWVPAPKEIKESSALKGIKEPSVPERRARRVLSVLEFREPRAIKA
jgi:hypothetical protein